MDSISSGISTGSTSADCVVSISTGISSSRRCRDSVVDSLESPLRTLDGALALSGARKQVAKSRRREVDALIAGDLLQVVPVTVAEVALVAAVSTDCASIVFGDVRAAASSPDVRPALSTGGVFEIGRTRPFVLDVEAPRLAVSFRARFRGSSKNSRTRARLWRTVFRTVTWSASRPAVVPAVGRPELAELRAAMESVPVDAHDVGWWLVGECRSG